MTPPPGPTLSSPPLATPPPVRTMSAQAAEARQTGRGLSSIDAALGERGGPTPGPEALASVLEPSIVTVGRPPERKAGRSFLVGAVVGVVLLGAAVAALVARKPAAPAPAPQAQTTTP
jgi:hypothetical protein